MACAGEERLHASFPPGAPGQDARLVLTMLIASTSASIADSRKGYMWGSGKSSRVRAKEAAVTLVSQHSPGPKGARPAKQDRLSEMQSLQVDEQLYFCANQETKMWMHMFISQTV